MTDSPWYGNSFEDIDSKPDPALDALLGRLPRSLFIGFCYLVTLPALGAPLGKTSVVALVAILAGAVQIGRRVSEYGTVVLVSYALALWFGAAPGPATIARLAERAALLLLN